jgi:beta-lactam-binding protein with PASTA domain
VPEGVASLVDSLLCRDASWRPGAGATSAALGALMPQSPPAHVGRAQPVPAEPTEVLPANALTLPARSRPPRRRRRAVSAALAAAVAAAAGVILVAELRDSPLTVPNVVAQRENVARAQILRALPDASVSVVQAYSDRVGRGRVIGQHPLPRSNVPSGTRVMLTISKGSPFAKVPAVAGAPAADARAALARAGFAGRFRYTPSWTIRKGRVIELRPPRGTRLRRPATVRIFVASGYPRAVVPNVQKLDLQSAGTQLTAKHLRYRVVYRLDPSAGVNQVLDQSPSPGATVYSGARIRLTVARTHRWVTVFADTGSDAYQSDPFSVPDRWRIRYRLTAGKPFFPALAQFSWARAGQPWGNGGFFANGSDGLAVYSVQDGAGVYRLGVSPYAGTAWYVEVDAFR